MLPAAQLFLPAGARPSPAPPPTRPGEEQGQRVFIMHVSDKAEQAKNTQRWKPAGKRLAGSWDLSPGALDELLKEIWV